MVQFNLQQVFFIKQFTLEQWKENSFDRNYLEIIFIEKGKGIWHTKGEKINYRSKNIFLVPPNTKYDFIIEEETSFYFLQFTDLLFSNRVKIPDRSYWLRRIDFILKHPNLKTGDIISNEIDRKILWDIQKLVRLEYEYQEEYFKNVIANLISASLSLIARNINGDGDVHNFPKADKRELIDDILDYIHKHVYEPQHMKIAHLAEHFNKTPSTLSNYFKKHSGKSIHHYILLHKLDLVKYRLGNTDFTVSQIAYQLGFTDESHLTRIFKKYEDITPKKFKSNLEIGT